MKKFLWLVPAALYMTLISCSQESDDLDSDLRFAINTAEGSRGLSSYMLPSSDNFNRIPQDPLNPITAAKVQLGAQLFHESGFGTVGEFEEFRGTYSCASCHHAGAGFQANMIQGIGDGGIGFGTLGEGRRADKFVEASKIDVQPLRSPSVLNVAYQTNMLWNGQFGATNLNESTSSLWPDEGPISVNRLGYEGVEVQAIAGLTVHRHDINPANVDSLGYKSLFDQAFRNIPEDRRYNLETAGLAIAAYERTVLANQAPFQQWLAGNPGAMTEDEKRGAILFFDKGECTTCHNGPNLANMEFHALGMNNFVRSEVLNFTDDDPSGLGRASFTKEADDEYKFKVPQLYNLKDSPFYGHGSSFRSIKEVVEYKNNAISENTDVPIRKLSPYFEPLELNPQEVELLTLFIRDGLYDANLSRYVPSSVLTGSCIPNNDWMSKQDLGCQ